MEDNFIYDDLDNQGDLGAIITDLQTKNKQLQNHVTSLEDDVRKLCDRITEMKTVQDNLTKNISALFNTAKSELDRKNRRINELQSQLDDMIFKRNSKPQPGFKRKQEEPNVDNSKRARYETIEAGPWRNVDENLGRCDRNVSGSKEDIKKSEKLNLESDFHSSLREDNDPMRKTYSKDNSHWRDKRDNYRENRDSYRDNRDSFRGSRDSLRDNYNDRNTCRDSKTEFAKGHWTTYKDRFVNKNYPRDKGGRSWDYRENNREHRDYRENRERTGEFRNDRPEMKHTIKSQTDDFKYTEDNNRQMDRHSEFKPVFSMAESTSGTPMDVVGNLENSKEEGELSDWGPEIEHRKVHKKRIEFGHNLPFDDKNSFNVYKYINNQKGMLQKDLRNKRNDIIEEPKTNDTSRRQSDKKNENPVEKSEFSEKRVIEGQIEDMVDKKTMVKDAPSEKICNDDFQIRNNETIKQQDIEKNSSVNIISQVILKDGDMDAIPSALKSEPEKKSGKKIKKQEIKEKQKTDKKKRESRVPRNLTDELNIDTDRSRKKQDLLTQIFGSPSPEVNRKKLDTYSPTPSISLSHDGDIPKLKLFSNPVVDSSDESKSLNPVTEFQIFKTNLSSLEKSNSLSGIKVQIQAPNKEDKEIPPLKDEKTNPTISEKTEAFSNQKEIIESLTSQQTINQEETFRQTTSDVCNISLDLLNMDIGLCKTEDFPNLMAHSNSKDISDLLLTPKEEKKRINPERTSKNKSSDTTFNQSIPSTSKKSPHIRRKSSSSSSRKIEKTTNEEKETPILKDGTLKSPHGKIEQKPKRISEEVVIKKCQVSTQEVIEDESISENKPTLPCSNEELCKNSAIIDSNLQDVNDSSTALKEVTKSAKKKASVPIKTKKPANKTNSAGNKITNSSSNITDKIETSHISQDENIILQKEISDEKSNLISALSVGQNQHFKQNCENSGSTSLDQPGENTESQKSGENPNSIDCSVQKTKETLPKKSKDTVKTRSNTNVNKKAIDKSTTSSSKKHSNLSKESSSLSNINDSSKPSDTTRSEKEKLPKNKRTKRKSVCLVKVDQLVKQKKISEEPIVTPCPVDSKAVVEDENCNAKVDSPREPEKILTLVHHSYSTDASVMPSKQIKVNVNEMVVEPMNPDELNETRSTKNVNKELVDVYEHDLSEGKAETGKENSNTKEKLITQAVSSEGGSSCSTKNKTTPNMRRRRGVVKWVQ